ncbi:carbohydrate kinase family protein [Geothrix paludis]|uniref:carbohydrate kinase family protein n=1 Tax=Geothrix paludis TaxID=2922722 RepID=UPI001FAD4812|nr:carbohydrate kinase family protein [Geothrix paludis]
MIPPEVVVVGCAGLDTNVYLPPEGIDWTVEGNFTENLDCVGQAGGYASLGYAALGRRVGFIGHVGEDAAGGAVRQRLADAGVDLRGLGVDPTGTARSVNLMYPDGRRKNFYDGKGRTGLDLDLPLCREVMSGARLAHLNIPDWARRLLPMAKELGLTVACDLQDVLDPADSYRRDFIEQADILFFSAANHGDPSTLIRAFLAGHPDRIVVSGMGAQGCALGTRGGIAFFPPVANERPVVDTNGAGDALAVGFLTSYVLEGRSLEASIRRGQIAARHTCTLRGTSSGLITARELDARSR